MSSPAVAGPAASLGMRTLAQLSQPPYELLSHGRLRRAVNDVGEYALHGHRRGERAHWEVAEAVAIAWKGGASHAEQVRICPMCAHLAAIPTSTRGPLRSVPTRGRTR